MTNELSVLIPVYNDCASQLVRQIAAQAAEIQGLQYEIIIGDDGSDDAETVRKNAECAGTGNCKLLRFDTNRGRSAIRNALADGAKYRNLLFIDGGHMRLCNEKYLQTYLSIGGDWQVVYGGYCLSEPQEDVKRSNLRYKYELQNSRNMSAMQRNDDPCYGFHSSNFLVRKDVFRRVRFDERFVRYGYEDVFMGKMLAEQGIKIQHIDNPTVFSGYEENAVFLQKTIDSLLTLKEFESEIGSYSRLANNARLCKRLKIDGRLRNLYRLKKEQWTANLTGHSPSLTVFKLFKLGFFLTL